MLDNRVNAQLSPEDKAEVIAALKVVREKLPFLIGLSNEQRRNLSKASDARVAFVSKTLTLAQQVPEILPQAFNVDDFKRDVDLLEALRGVAGEVAGLNELLDDTLIALSHEAYTSARTVYRFAKADRGHGLDSIITELREPFPQRGKRRAKKGPSAAADPSSSA